MPYLMRSTIFLYSPSNTKHLNAYQAAWFNITAKRCISPRALFLPWQAFWAAAYRVGYDPIGRIWVIVPTDTSLRLYQVALI